MKILILLFALVSFSCVGQEDPTTAKTEILSATAFKKATSENVVQLIDVRTAEEFADGHIENAVNIDYFSEDFKTAFDAFDKREPIYIYCKSGNRSGKAAVILSELGYLQIYDLEGGFTNYK